MRSVSKQSESVKLFYEERRRLTGHCGIKNFVIDFYWNNKRYGACVMPFEVGTPSPVFKIAVYGDELNTIHQNEHRFWQKHLESRVIDSEMCQQIGIEIEKHFPL